MKRKIVIELFEKYEAITFYTIRFSDESEDETEYDKFCEKFDGHPEFNEDFEIINEWLSSISETGALERLFRPEGGKGKLKALPIDGGKLRHFGLRISDCIYIIGNGDKKKTGSWQNNPLLKPIGDALSQIATHLQSRINKGAINVYQCELFGNLEFTIELETQPNTNEEE